MKLKQKVRVFLVSATIMASLLVGVSPTLAAAASTTSCDGVTTAIISCPSTSKNKQQGTCPNGVTQNVADKCADGSMPVDIQDTGVWSLLILAINILTAGVGLAAVGGVIYGAVLYTSAGGSQEQVKKAIGVLTNVAIGIVAYALMWALLNFLIPGGVLN